jgi:hypothetical protein
MRAVSWARWATCALAISISIPISIPVATADRARKSLASCTVFDQVDKGDEVVAFTIHNSCSVPIDCRITWRVVCAPESKSRRASHPGKAMISISGASTGAAEASAAMCGDDSWQLDSVQWSCVPNKD